MSPRFRRILVRPRVTVLLPVIATAALMVALRPGDITRATTSRSWAPLPATAFVSLPPLTQSSTISSKDERGDERALRTPPAISSDRAVRIVSGWPPEGPPVTAPALPLSTQAQAPKAPTRPRRPAPVTSRPETVRPISGEQPTALRVPLPDHLWPLPIRGDLTRRFSQAHPGIDIAVSKGTRVRAIADGKVVWSGWIDNGGGYVVEIEGGDGMRSTYNHNSKVTVKRGDEVSQGDTVALVGSTGRSTGPHLDLRIRMGGRLVNPLELYN